MTKDVELRFYTSDGLVGRLIRWQTRSPVGHVALYWPDEGFWTEAVEGRGVVQRMYERADLFTTTRITLPHGQQAFHWAMAQLGKKYDYTMVLRFLTREKETRHSNDAYFCSEYASTALRLGGVVPLANSAPWRESPGHLLTSPILFPSGTAVVNTAMIT